MVNAGRILIVPKGVWSSLTSYDMLDLVTQDGVAYIARQANVGVQPKTDSQYTYWQPFGNVAEPDNETIVYNANNRYTVNLDGKTLVYDSNDGITVAIDGETIKFDEDEGYLYAEVKSNLADLLDVVLTTPVNGQVLTYNAVTGKWVNANPTGGMQAHLVITSEAGSTVTVTTPSGSVITATQVSGSTTQWECDTQEYGVHTIDAVLAGDDARITVTVDACKVYNIDDSHIHASITVTFPRGFTCRCQGQGENYYSNSNPYTFSVHHLGEFTITATDGADTTYTETVTISSSAQSVSMFCPSAENAPTDDIQLWLMEGGILDKTYTTLSEVLADSTTLATLIADNNAVDYMVRSKSWCGVGLVPKMTSNNTPSGVAFASTEYDSSYEAWKAFDEDSSTGWGSSINDGVGSYIGYIFTEPKCVKRLKLYNVASNNNTMFGFKIQGSNNTTTGADGTWIDIDTKTAVREENPPMDITNSTSYLAVRLLATNTNPAGAKNNNVMELQFYSENLCDDSTAMSYIGLNNYASNTLLADSDWLNAICNSAYFESVLNIKVPTMTSNTTPSGVAFGLNLASTAADPYKAFNDLTEDFAFDNKGNDLIGKGVGYQFPNQVRIAKVRMHTRYDVNGYHLGNYVIEASNDGTTYKQIATGGTTTTDWDIILDAITLLYEYFRIRCTSNLAVNSAYPQVDLQFYGRIDV